MKLLVGFTEGSQVGSDMEGFIVGMTVGELDNGDSPQKQNKILLER